MRRHIPTLYAHAERRSDDIDDDEADGSWSTPTIHRQMSYPSPGVSSLSKSRMKQRSPTSLIPATSNNILNIPSSSTSNYSDVYSQFVKRYRSRPNQFYDASDDPESSLHFRAGSHYLDDSDDERPGSSQGLDGRDRYASVLLENDPLQPVTVEERERLEWQSMLASVLDGEVLRSEKSRIQTALMTSSGGPNNRHLDIWLGIRARQRGRKVDEERKNLEERRLHVVDRVITEIMAFKVLDGSDFKSAELQVNTVLRHLDKIQSLYPHLKAFYLDKTITASPEFQARCDTLITWSTISASLHQQIQLLRRWTRSDTLDVNERSSEKDGSSFVERVLKEETIQRTFEKGSLLTVHALIASARDTQVNLMPMFRELNLPTFEDELVQLISFPTRLVHACLHVHLQYANKVTDPDVLIVDQMLEDFRLTIGLACTLKRQYEAFLLPDPGGNWNLPSCIDDDYDSVLLEALHVFFKLINWKLKSGSKDIYFRETEVLEAQWATFNDVSLTVKGAASVIAEQLCFITHKLIVRATNNFDRQVRLPILGKDKRPLSSPHQTGSPAMNGLEFDFRNRANDGKAKVMSGEQMIGWYEKVLEGVKTRYRKLQRFSRSLSQRFGNAAEYTLQNPENASIDRFIASLVATDHFLVYTQSYEEEGTYVVASRGLRDRTEAIRRILEDSFHVNDIWEDGYRSGTVRHQAEAQQHLEDNDSDIADEPFDEPSYILLLSPRMRFLWNGLVVILPITHVDFEIKDNRVRLIADGSGARLSRAKEQFTDMSFSFDEADENVASYNPILNCVVEQMAHLPAVNKELKKINRVTNRLAESIVDAVHFIRESLSTTPNCMELLESWYSFSSEHGQHAQKHMDKASILKFNRLLIRLAISWVSFICDDCDPTDRRTFRWAVSALEFVLSRTKRNNILHLPDDQFEMLRQKVASCMTLLISHFDILGARSALDAKKEKERKDELKLHGLNLYLTEGEKDEENLWEPIVPLAEGSIQSALLQTSASEMSIRRFRDEMLRKLASLDEKRAGAGAEQHLIGRVLDEKKPEDQSLMFLASATSNVSVRWQQGKFIGAGAFGSVYTAVNLDTGTVMAVKEIRVQEVTSTPNLYKQIQDELKVMEMLHHPNVVEFYGIEVHRDKVYIFEEYCEGGSLAANLEVGRIADENILQIYTLQMLEGLSYLHSKGIVHRDIKPDNILLDHMGVLKFVDFGAAKVIAKSTRTINRTRIGTLGLNTSGLGSVTGLPDGSVGLKNSLTGTPMYMSPEVIKNDRQGRLGAMDIWSMGCVVLECATGRKPWSNLDNEWAIMFHIGVATQHPPLPEKGELSELGINFIKQCLTLDPVKRPTTEELKKHPWMVQFMEFLSNYEEEELANSPPIEMPADREFKGATVARQAAILQEKEVEAMKLASPVTSEPNSPPSSSYGSSAYSP